MRNFYFYFLCEPKDGSSPLGNFAPRLVAPREVLECFESVSFLGSLWTRYFARKIANVSEFNFFFKYRGKLYPVSLC